MAYACAVSYLQNITIILKDIKYLNRPHKQETESRAQKQAFCGLRLKTINVLPALNIFIFSGGV